MTLLTHLGQYSIYKSQYDKSLLHQIKRSIAREGLKLPQKLPKQLLENLPQKSHGAAQQNETVIKDCRQVGQGGVATLSTQCGLPFYGYDLWNCYELSWLNLSGKPEVRILEFAVSADSEYIVESKSLKLYLNSFNNTKFASQQEVMQTIKTDLEECLGIAIMLSVKSLKEYAGQKLDVFKGVNLDELDIAINNFEIKEHFPVLAMPVDIEKAEFSQTALAVYDSIEKKSHRPAEMTPKKPSEIEELVYSNLLKSNCPVTNQPDWASIQIHYKGPKVDHESLLRYIVSFRNHNEFHEHCIERIFCDLLEHCKPTQLTVYARYTRRGGIDINPIRSTHYLDITKLDNLRHARQ